jgi:acetolactate synthase-1/2/3 large subunit
MTEQQKIEMESLNSGHGVARLLREHGVSLVFGIPDGHTLAFYDGILHTAGIKHILVNDERTAAFAADAYSRITGTLAVIDAGAAGALNFPVALAEAKGAGSAILALVGCVKSHDMLRNVPHDINVADTLTPVTKWTEKVIIPEHLPRFLSHAIRIAINGKPGPVGLVIAEDVWNYKEIKMEQFIPKAGGACSINGCRISPSMSEIDYAVQLIRTAKQPAIFSGEGALVSGAYAEIAKLSQMLKIPIFTTIDGKGIVANGPDTNYFGIIGLFGEVPNNRFVRKDCDLLIVVGNRLSEDDTANFSYPPPKIPMIQIDIDPGEVGLSYQPWGVIGDPKAALELIIKELEKLGPIALPDSEEIFKQRIETMTHLKENHIKFGKRDMELWMNADPIKPQRIFQALSEIMQADDYLVTDASASSRWIGPYFPVKKIGRHIITARGVGPTGFGVGAMIGTWFAVKEIYGEKNRPKTVLITGDGGLMNGGLSDFETIVKLGIDAMIVVINNAVLGYVRYGQALMYHHRYIDTDRPQTDFARITEAFGGKGFRVNVLKELDSILSEAYAAPGFRLVDIKTDPQELLPPNYYGK